MDNYEEIYDEAWKPILETPKGNIKKTQLKKELADYARLIQQTVLVYKEVTGGAITHPMTPGQTVVNLANEYMNTLFAHFILYDLAAQMQDPSDYDIIVAYATEISPGEVERWRESISKDVPKE